MKIKRIIAVWMTAGMIMASLAGCGGKDDTAKTAAGQEHAEDTTDAKENKVDKGGIGEPCKTWNCREIFIRPVLYTLEKRRGGPG